jgi:hypothetical protein
MVNRILPLFSALTLLAGAMPATAVPVVVARGFTVSRSDISRLLSRIETETDRFRRSVDRALDRSRLNGRPPEDRINAYIADFENATDRLKKEYRKGKSVDDEVQMILSAGRRIDRALPRRSPVWEQANEDWDVLREDLDELARIAPVARF